MACSVSSRESVDRLKLSVGTNRKVGTTYTQIVDRIQLSPIKPQCQVTDLEDINSEDFRKYPILGQYRGEQDFFDKGLPSLLEITQIVSENITPNLDSPVRVSIFFGVQPPAAEETVNQPDSAPVMAELLTMHHAH